MSLGRTSGFLPYYFAKSCLLASMLIFTSDERIVLRISRWYLHFLVQKSKRSKLLLCTFWCRYYPPSVQDASTSNGPAVGGNTLMITGDSFGPFDYTPTAYIGICCNRVPVKNFEVLSLPVVTHSMMAYSGISECVNTLWTSNTALSCVTAPCTTFLARANLELVVRVKVGLAHQLTSFQIGELDAFYSYDFPLEFPFVLNNTEVHS